MSPNTEGNHERSRSSTKKITLADIAKAVGVSRTTVSLALANNKKISEKRRKEIRQKAEELGYRPDPHLAALAQYRKKSRTKPAESIIAWLNFWEEPERMRTYREFDLYWQGAAEAANMAGYKLEEFNAFAMPPRRMANILASRGIEGILLAPYPAESQDLVASFPFADFKTIRFGWNFCKPFLHSVTCDLIGSAELAFKHMYEKGYRRIGFAAIKGWKRPFSAGFFWAQHYSDSLPTLKELLLPSDLPVEQRIHMLEEWLKSEQPDAILTDLAKLPEWLADLGYAVPGDFGLATLSPYDTPIDAGIDQNPEEIGRTSIRTLISLLADWNEETLAGIKAQTLVPARWVDGASLPSKKDVADAA